MSSADEDHQSAAKGSFVEAPLSFALLESLLPIGGSELEDAALGPVGQQVEEVTEIGPGLDAMHFAAGNEGDEDGVGKGPVGGADEAPIFSTDGLPPEVSFGDVVRKGQPAVVQKAFDGGALVDGIANGRGDKLRDLRLSDATEGDYARADSLLGKAVPRNHVFILETNDRRYLIVAAAMKVFENELDVFESSLERFG